MLSFAITDLVAPEDFESSYYHYWGSLTTPPCTPAVSWHLARNTVKVRGSTMDAFRASTKEWTTSSGRVNADRYLFVCSHHCTSSLHDGQRITFAAPLLSYFLVRRLTAMTVGAVRLRFYALIGDVCLDHRELATL